MLVIMPQVALALHKQYLETVMTYEPTALNRRLGCLLTPKPELHYLSLLPRTMALFSTDLVKI